MSTKRKKRKHGRKNRSETRRELKQKAVNYKGGSCIGCGYNRCLAALTFHHIDPGKKNFDISAFLKLNWEKLRKELDECNLLCTTCHVEVHNNLRDGYDGKLK